MAAATATMALSVQRTASAPFEQLLDEANGPHVLVYDAAPGAKAALVAHPGVEAVSGPIERGSGSYSSGDRAHPLTLWAVESPMPEVQPALMLEGRWLEPGRTDEIVIDSGLANESGLQIGDRVALTTDAGPHEVEVVGVAASTGRPPYPIWDPAAVYVTLEALATLGGNAGNSSVLAVRLVDPESAIAVLREVNGDRAEPLVAAVTRWQEIDRSIREDARLKVIVLSTFSAFALLAVGFIVANVVSGQALAQRREIGLLKATGFTPRDASLLFAGQHLFLGVSGIVIGATAGVLTTPYWLGDIARRLGQPPDRSAHPVDLAIVAVGVLVVLLLFTIFPAWRAGRLSTIDALRRADRPDRGASQTHALASRLPVPRAAATGLKDLFTRPARTLLAIGAMAMAAATIMFTLTIDATVNGLAEDPTIVGEGRYDLRVDRLTARFVDPSMVAMSTDDDGSAPEQGGEAVLSEADAIAAVSQAGVAGIVEARQFGVQVNGRSVWSRMVDGDLEQLHVRFTEGGWHGDREVVVGYALSEASGIGVGDRVTVSAADRRIEATVSGIYVEGSNSGLMAMMRPSMAEALFGRVPYAELWLVLDDDAEVSAVAAAVRRASGGLMGVTDGRAAAQRDIRAAGDTLRSVLYPLNVVLLAIAVANLLTALLFTVRERYRDYALLKAIGFTPRQILLAVSSGALVIAAIGTGIGAPLGYFVTSALVDYFGAEDGWPSGVASAPSALWVLGLMALAVGIAIAGSWLPAQRAASTGVAEALRYE